MILKNLIVKNFRNFKEVDIDLSNKNVIFGMNDSGKTNLLSALRFLLDRQVRSKGFLESDYHKNDTSSIIEIQLKIDISDRNEETEEGNNSKFLISRISGARNSEENLDSFFIKLKAEYDSTELFGNPILSWGSTIDNLIDIPQRGETYDVDKIFKLIYIEPTIDLDNTFKRNKRILFKDEKKEEGDIEIEDAIKKNIDDMNVNIGKLGIVNNVQNELTETYKEFRKENLKIELQSEIMIKGYLDNLTPYIKWSDDEGYYPTSGDGRKKLLSYALHNIISKQTYDKHIVIYLIEEPENSLHRSMQLALSKQLFKETIYNYFFMTTHSNDLLYEMDDTQLVRISNSGISTSKSYYYNVPEDYKSIKKRLNKDLSQSIFYNNVLLVEGGSEYQLFETVLSHTNPEYEINGNFMMQVDGINFKPYVDLFQGLGINYLVKTDNDLKRNSGGKYDVIGINRCLKILDRNIDRLESIDIEMEEGISKKDKKARLIAEKRNLFKKYESIINDFKNEGIYLSEIDLEYDLYRAIPEKLKELTNEENPVEWLQKKKLHNMIEFIEKIDAPTCNIIFQKFEVLGDFINGEKKINP